jgi:pSer/pThr/pTyr-binding forkhead associated (FHA) protein
MFETQPSPSVSVTSPEGRNVSTPSARRGLNKLRSLAQSRQQAAAGTSTDSSRTSPRRYFARSASSASCTERRTGAENSPRPRSSSRPDASRPDALLIVNECRRSRSTSRHRNAQPTPNPPNMARTRNSAASRAASDSLHSAEAHRFARAGGDGAGETNGRTNRTSPGNGRSAAAGGENGDDKEIKSPLPTIRLFPHQEMRNGRQSLPFTPITRTLPREDSIIRVGRYSEREGIPTTNPTVPSDAPIGFKSKVVSRKHCEFSFKDGQWQIKDVCSSSGTFLNHIRLSQPNMESKFFPVKDGDIVQLGIDFRGGEEMIFRCVKMRIECNRSWQKRPNNFK